MDYPRGSINVGAFTAAGDYPDVISVNVVSPNAVVISTRSESSWHKIALTHTEYAEFLRELAGEWARFSKAGTILGEPPKPKAV